jgi:hypothetical protein
VQGAFKPCASCSFVRTNRVHNEPVIITSAKAVQQLGPLVGGTRKVFAEGHEETRELLISRARDVSDADGTARSLREIILRQRRPSDGLMAYASRRHVAEEPFCPEGLRSNGQSSWNGAARTRR